MESKKNKKYQLESKRILFFQYGLVLGLLVVYSVFNWSIAKVPLYEHVENELIEDNDDVIFEFEILEEEKPKTPDIPKQNFTPLKIEPIVPITNEFEINDNRIDETVDFSDFSESEEDIEPFTDFYDEPEIELETIDFNLISETPYLPNCKGLDNTESKRLTEKEIIRIMSRYVRFPAILRHERISETVYVSFVINPEGNIEQVKILNEDKIHFESANEARRLIRKIPQFIPGKHLGKAVKVSYVLPIKFMITR